MNTNLIDATQKLIDAVNDPRSSVASIVIATKNAKMAIKQTQAEPQPKLIVFNSDDGFQVFGIDRKEYPTVHAVDYCLEDRCPVCGEEDHWNSDPCRECGYFDDIQAGKDNALECAIKLIEARESK